MGDRLDAIVLYGSVARGAVSGESDVDLLVLTGEVALVSERLAQLRFDYTFDRDFAFFISLLCLSSEQMERLFELRSPFMRNVLAEGVPLYDNGTFARLYEQATSTSP